ncbi:MAG: hypothetical protein Q9185_000306 [Variospora sp. 1 TL-2023]
MSQYYPQPSSQPYNPSQQQQQPNLNFYQSSYPAPPVSGHSTPSQAAQYPYSSHHQQNAYGQSQQGNAYGPSGTFGAFGGGGGGGTLTVLNPLAPISQHIMDDSDLAGPILFFLLFGTFLLFSGKVHFGYIYGLALVGSLSLHTIFSLMSPPADHESPSSSHAPPNHHHHGHTHPNDNIGGGNLNSTLTFPRSASVLGYCLLPLVLTSLVGVAAPMDTLGGYAISVLAICWCTYSSSGMFCAVGRMRSMRGLVAYPLGLFYTGFGIMGIFSSKGSGALARAGG